MFSQFLVASCEELDTKTDTAHRAMKAGFIFEHFSHEPRVIEARGPPNSLRGTMSQSFQSIASALIVAVGRPSATSTLSGSFRTTTAGWLATIWLSAADDADADERMAVSQRVKVRNPNDFEPNIGLLLPFAPP